MRRKRLKLALGIAVALFIALAGVVLWPQEHLVRRTARETFYIDMPFEEVRKILVRSEATDDILALGDMGELKEYTWTKRGLGLESLNIFNPLATKPASSEGGFSLAGVNLFNPDWRIHAEAVMKVQTSDEEYVGSHLITLTQDVDIEQEFLESTILLAEGTERLRDYENRTRFSPDGERTKVETSLTLSILVSAPNFLREHANRRVQANAAGKLETQKAGIHHVIDENKGKPLPLIPLNVVFGEHGENEDGGDQASAPVNP
jgi:hypothetical protein